MWLLLAPALVVDSTFFCFTGSTLPHFLRVMASPITFADSASQAGCHFASLQFRPIILQRDTVRAGIFPQNRAESHATV
jgi:hypothetical protein